MKKIWLALIGLFLIQYKSYAFTNYLECTGFDGLGQKVNANIYCSQGCKKVTAYINGDKFTAVGETKDSQGFVTKKFVTTQGVYVYDSVVFSKKNYRLIFINLMQLQMLLLLRLHFLVTSLMIALITILNRVKLTWLDENRC